CQTGLLAVPEALGTMLQVVTEGVKRRHPKQPATLDIYKQERGKFFSNILHACKYQVPASSMGAGTLHAQCVNAGIPFYIPCGPTRVVTVNFIWRGFTASFGGFNHFVGDGIQLSSAGSCWIRRYRVARDMPKSRATWVAGSPASMNFIALRIWLSVEARRRPPRSLPTARRMATESVIRPRLISNSICANAAITVNTIDPIGVEVSTSPPPRLSTRNPAPRSRSCWAKVSMLWADRPNRSNVAITNVSPDSRAARA